MATFFPSKKQMTEEDIKLNYITPALQSKWQGKITMETSVKNVLTEGEVKLAGNMAARDKSTIKKTDYILWQNESKPIAVVEAKDNNKPVGHGLQQAMEYAEMLDVKFAYASNGDAFLEHDFTTGKEREIALGNFPAPEELQARLNAALYGENGMTEEQKAILQTPFYSDENTYEPRYYQRVAVNRTLEAIANGQKRLLLVMATGTGKTFTAFQIVWRLLQAETVKKVLYLADRNVLVDQAKSGDFKPLEKVTKKINYAKDDKSALYAYNVYFSLYQQLTDRGGDDDEEGEVELSKLEALFDKNFFDLIVVDECHRGSAKADSNWRKILEYFEPAIQLGMTATPKETEYVSNIDYFGEPVYEYSLKQGIKDGFLAPFKVYEHRLDIDEGWRPTFDQKDKDGNLIEDREYNVKDYDKNIIIEDRTRVVAEEITKYLKSTDRWAKTIVFCETEEAALRMRIELANQNADMVKKHPDYVVRITGSDDAGRAQLDNFTHVSTKTPVIATTSCLLSTGVDCKMVKLIVLNKSIGSMTEFKQIVGRGTRLREKDGKTHFVIMDFKGATRLFADPDWDGPIEPDPTFDPTKAVTLGGGATPTEPQPPKPIIDKNGCRVEVVKSLYKVYSPDGKLLRTENVVDYTRHNVLDTYSSLENFIKNWTEEEKKEVIVNGFKERGINLESLRADMDMQDCDYMDFLCHLAYGKKPLTRRERANNVKKRDFLSKYSPDAQKVLTALLERYENEGIVEIEGTEILKLDPLKQFGAPTKIVNMFGGKQNYLKAVKELEGELYADVITAG